MWVVMLERNWKKEVCNNGRVYGLKYEAALARDEMQGHFPDNKYTLCELKPTQSLNED